MEYVHFYYTDKEKRSHHGGFSENRTLQLGLTLSKAIDDEGDEYRPGFERLSMSTPALPLAGGLGHGLAESVPVVLRHAVGGELGVLGAEVAAFFRDSVGIVDVADRLVEQFDEHDAVLLARLNRRHAQSEHPVYDEGVLEDFLDIRIFVKHSLKDRIPDIALAALADMTPGVSY